MANAENVRRYPRALLLVLTVGLVAVSIELLSLTAIGLYNSIASEPIRTRSETMRMHLQGLASLVDGTTRREALHPVYGWSYQPSFSHGRDTLNSAGLRSSREYGAKTTEPMRVAAFGNSFVYCNEVSNADCWTSQLEARWRADVLNYGVGGYGTDQALLRYLAEGQEFNPDIVLLGFQPVNLGRIVNRYRGFISPDEGPWFKPRFQLGRRDELRLLETPVPTAEEALRILSQPGLLTQIGQTDYWYRPKVYEHRTLNWSATYRLVSNLWTKIQRHRLDSERLYDTDGGFRPQSEAFSLQIAVMATFVDSVSADGAEAVVLLLPGAHELSQVKRGQRPSYAPLLDSLRGRAIDVIDPILTLAEEGDGASLFAPGGHYSPHGNSLIARHVADALSLEDRVDERR